MLPRSKKCGFWINRAHVFILKWTFNIRKKSPLQIPEPVCGWQSIWIRWSGAAGGKRLRKRKRNMRRCFHNSAEPGCSTMRSSAEAFRSSQWYPVSRQPLVETNPAPLKRKRFVWSHYQQPTGCMNWLHHEQTSSCVVSTLQTTSLRVFSGVLELSDAAAAVSSAASQPVILVEVNQWAWEKDEWGRKTENFGSERSSTRVHRWTSAVIMMMMNTAAGLWRQLLTQCSWLIASSLDRLLFCVGLQSAFLQHEFARICEKWGCWASLSLFWPQTCGFSLLILEEIKADRWLKMEGFFIFQLHNFCKSKF